MYGLLRQTLKYQRLLNMDMLSMCRKRNNYQSPETIRRSPRFVEKERKWGSCENLKNTSPRRHGVGTSRGSPTSSLVSDIPAISESKDGSVILRVMAKPGAKQNAITDIGSDFVGIQIGAPARDSQANYELVEYLSGLLKLRKSDITVDKGLRSKIKTVKITRDGFTTDNLKELLSQEFQKE